MGRASAGGGARWRVFVSYTSELREYPKAGPSYVAAVERAVSACGHVIVDMADFPAADQVPADVCAERVRSCEVYVGVLGTRYGSPVRHRPEVSYTELELEAAAKAGLDRLVFVLDDGAAGTGIPPSGLIDRQFGEQQDAFRRRVQDSGLVTASFGNPDALGRLVERSLRELAARRPGGGKGGDTLPPRNPVFTGREEMLAQVGRQLDGGPVAVVAVRGLGGMGKSQVALEYAHRMRASGRYQVAAWVRADSPVTVAEDLAAAAPLLGLPADGPAGEVAGSVVAALGARRDWLVVFDNAQAPGDLAGLVPGGAGHVLITSRNRAWSGAAFQLDLEVFSRAESVVFLCKRSGRPESEAAGELASELGDLPLALAQAAAYIDARALTVGGYLALYRDPVLARRLRDEGLDAGEYPASVARTWLLTIGQLSAHRPVAVELLRLCAFLGPDDIDLEVLAAGAAETTGSLYAALGDRLERTEAAGALARASLVTATAQDRLRVHRLVQAVTRDQLDEDLLAAWSGRVLDLVTAVFPGKPQDYRSWPVCAIMASHVEAVTTQTGGYRNLAGKSARLLGRLGVYLCASAQSRAALEVLERALAMAEAGNGPGHSEAAVILNNLGMAQWDLGDLAAARASVERALAIEETVYGPGHPELATALNNLGAILGELGDLAAARASVERALAIDQAAYGPGHPEVASTLNNLGAVQRRLGELTAARTTLERALAIEEAAFGPEHPEVADILSNLGAVQRQQGDLPAAYASVERALAIKQAAYGPNHPEVASILSNLGAVQRELGEVTAARSTLERALAIKQAVYGPSHPEVADIISNLHKIQQPDN